jgi:hypothetical protein
MLGLASPAGPTELTLEVEEGELKAYVGAKRDKRQIAEPLHLGPDWRKEFGVIPAPAFGCIEGACRADNFSYEVERKPSSSPGAQPPTAPRQEVPAKTVAPAPAKRPATKAPPPQRGKRSK